MNTQIFHSLTWARIDLKALEHNWAELKKLAALITAITPALWAIFEAANFFNSAQLCSSALRSIRAHVKE